ncbi:RPA family protein, a subunit of RPA complex in P.furiosus [Halanaeroarchaeum sp. HSR-CO]|uniref:RPA family protein n=1 Tax=Halanaeroarchaeum sp. HSR-CO TaxID=2866382 RepID=UPI00217D1445|nr:hypothetical protein [Halanaeroarchaeum sp. HSR-CO]UWG48300.1 RPA family protein, a subunit of RPA complex in P.furiosus [Halanaeroarchaeum sp. HSR-CO]
MSGERPQREVAYRLFAAEFEDSDFTYAESDEERAPNYVVTPTGARVNRVFAVGVLTELEQVSDDVLRARIVDPTGAFVVYAGQYQPEALAFFERTDPPEFVAVTGKARTFQPDDSDIVYTSIRPESANRVTAETRDRWVVQTAEQTIDRIETFAGALDMAERGDALAEALERRGIQPGLAAGIPKAIDQYGTTTGYLAEIHRVALDAARVVANELDEVEAPTLAPDEGADVDLGFEYSLQAPEYAVEDDESADTSEATADETAAETEAVATMDTQSQTDTEAEAETEETEAAAVEAEAPKQESSTDEPVEEASADVGETEAHRSEAASDEDAAETTEPEAEEEVGSLEDPDEMYELSEEEREEVKSEFGVDFATGNEVDSAGEAGIETPEPEEPVDTSEAEPVTQTEPESSSTATEPDSESEPDDTAGDESDAKPAAAEAKTDEAEDIDLEDVVVETMGELDDGDGAPRDELVKQVVEEHGVGTDAVEDAIQDALMGGRCYEPSDDRITPI